MFSALGISQTCRLARTVLRLRINRCYSSKNDVNVVPSPYGDCVLHQMTVAQRFFETSVKWPQNVAMECGITGRKYTYGQLQVLVRRFGSALVRMGFKKGQVLGLILPNIPEYPVALLGASGVGMPVALINPIYTAEEIANLCRTSGTAVIVGVSQMAPVLRRAAQLCPSIQRMIVIGEHVEGFITISEMFNDPGDLFTENLDLNPTEDVFVLPHSSGTTGPPKSVMLTHNNILANIQQGMHSVGTGQLRISGDVRDIYVCVLPFTHIYGLVAQLLTVLETGAKAVTLPKFDAPSFLNAIYSAQPSIMYVAPPIISFLAQFPGLKLEAFRNLNVLFSGGSATGASLIQKLFQRFEGFNFTFREGFGCTECSPVTHFTPHVGAKVGSIGFPISRTSAKITDIESGAALGPNQTGELCIKGPQIMKGYLNNPDATREAIDSSGWLHTGDVAYYDQDGHFFVVDRIKELIKVKGLQVSPSEMEDLIRQHPAVLDAGVVGIPDDYAGELPRAYVVLKPEVTLTEEDLMAFVHPKVSAHKHLKGGIQFVGSLPLSMAGKILRRELKAQALKEASLKIRAT